jgi:hypothetical protein
VQSADTVTNTVSLLSLHTVLICVLQNLLPVTSCLQVLQQALSSHFLAVCTMSIGVGTGVGVGWGNDCLLASICCNVCRHLKPPPHKPQSTGPLSSATHALRGNLQCLLFRSTFRQLVARSMHIRVLLAGVFRCSHMHVVCMC